MAADGEVTEVERAALTEHLDECAECTEWRALAEAVVLHVRTTPPSAVPEGLLPALPSRRRRHRSFALRTGGFVAAASVAAVLGVAMAGSHSTPPAQAQSGVVRPSEIVVGWNTSGTLDGKPVQGAGAVPSKPSR